MWFQLNTTFSTHLGALSTLQSNYGVTYSLSNFTKTTAPDMVEKDASLTVVLTMADGATFSTASMTDGTNTVTGSLDGSTVTMTISEVKGPVTVTARATIAGGSTDDETDDDTATYTFTVNPTPSSATVTLSASGYSTVSGTGSQSISVAYGTAVSWSVSASGYTAQSNTQTVTSTSSKSVTLSASSYPTSGTLPLVQNALSVVSGENFYQVSSTNNTRMSSSSITEATGIFVPAGKTITLTGTSGLRFDYVYATKAGPNSNDKTVNTIGGVGTASNFVSSNYFPLNTDGSSNTISITNNYGTDYYYFFAIAAPNKSSNILVSNYQGTITWAIS